MKMCVALISGFLIVAPAIAQNDPGSVDRGGGDAARQNDRPESSSGGGQGEDGARRICRRTETSSYSRMSGRRVCRTAEEWREADRPR